VCGIGGGAHTQGLEKGPVREAWARVLARRKYIGSSQDGAIALRIYFGAIPGGRAATRARAQRRNARWWARHAPGHQARAVWGSSALTCTPRAPRASSSPARLMCNLLRVALLP
jgi:hypothetical protein